MTLGGRDKSVISVITLSQSFGFGTKSIYSSTQSITCSVSKLFLTCFGFQI